MASTVDEVVGEVRRILSDTDTDLGYRYTDEQVISALNMGMLEMRRLRPDLFRSIYGQSLTRLTVADLGQSPAVDLIFDEMYAPPLAAYCAGWIELADDEFTVDNRAGILLQRFAQQLIMGG